MDYKVTYKNGKDRLFGENPISSVIICAESMEDAYDTMYELGVEDCDIISIEEVNK